MSILTSWVSAFFIALWAVLVNTVDRCKIALDIVMLDYHRKVVSRGTSWTFPSLALTGPTWSERRGDHV
ncbi:hypothetical protein [Streptomyces sp. SGAir0957]